MGNFVRVLPITLGYEGLFSDDPTDHGGCTMKGVTQRVYDAYRTAHHLPLQSVALISDTELQDIYHTQYWMPINGDSLEDGLSLQGFDAAVNHGVSRALKFLAACNQDIQTFGTLRDAFYHQIVVNNPSQVKFLKGWLARNDAIEKTALAWKYLEDNPSPKAIVPD